MDHRLQSRAEDQRISQESIRMKDSSTYVDIGDANESRKRGREKENEEKERPERPKILVNRNRITVFLHSMLFHAVPVGGAMALIVLNTRTRLYGIDGTRISAFQFVAKAHEIFMQASIITVMAAYLQYLLTHNRAVPFGAIFSAYRITDMSYLWSHEFYAALTTPNFTLYMKFAFLLFMSLSIILATAVGPSSAIAMQPRPVNLTVPDWRIGLNVTSDVLYPDSFGEAGSPLNVTDSSQNDLSPIRYLQNLPAMDGNTETGLQPDWCHPSKIKRYIMPKLYSTQVRTDTPYGALGDNSQGGSATRTLYVQHAPNGTFATVQSVPIALALNTASSKLLQYLNRRPGVAVTSIQTQQAYTSAFCRLNSIMDGNDTRPIEFPDTYVAGCNDEYKCRSAYGDDYFLNKAGITNYTAITRRQIWDQAKGHPQGRIIWADDVQISGPVAGAALGALVIHPEFCGANYTFLTVSACVIGARWANTTSYTHRTYNGDYFLRGGAVENSITPESPSTLPLWSQPSVKLSKAWAESLNPVTKVQNRTVADNILRWLPVTSNLCPTNGSYGHVDGGLPSDVIMRPFLHERFIASLVANGMSHATVSVWRSSWRPGMNDRMPATVLTFHGHLQGYAWNLDGTPIRVALSILSLYCAYVLVYISYTFVTGRSSMAWRSISGLMALAINSAPTEALEHTSAGIERTDTFRKLVSVRKVEEDERLEIVFKQNEDKKGPYRRVAVGRAY